MSWTKNLLSSLNMNQQGNTSNPVMDFSKMSYGNQGFTPSNNGGIFPQLTLGNNAPLNMSQGQQIGGTITNGLGTPGGGGLFSGFGDWMKGDTGQAAMTGLNIGKGLFDAWGGMQQLDLAKKQFSVQKEMMTKNYNAQKGLTNTRMKDRQDARNAADSSAYQDTGSYMKENEVK